MSDEMKADVERLKAETGNLRVTLRNVAHAVARMEGAIAELTDYMKHRVATKRDLNAVITCIDDFSAEVKTSRNERVLWDKTYNELKERVDDHELRITRQELRGKA